MSTLRVFLVIYKENGKEKYESFRLEKEARKFRNKKGGKVEIINSHINILSNISRDIGYGE